MYVFVRIAAFAAAGILTFHSYLMSIDVQWKQSAWTYSGYTNLVSSRLSGTTSFLLQDGFIVIGGIDYSGVAPVFLFPKYVIMPFIVDKYTLDTANLTAPYTASGAQVQVFDRDVFVPGAMPTTTIGGIPLSYYGSMRIGVTANNAAVLGSNFCYMSYYTNGAHPYINSSTNIFLYFFSKSDAVGALDGNRFRFSLMTKQASGAAFERRWDVSNFTFPSKSWVYNSAVINIPNSVPAYDTANCVLIPHFNVTDFMEHSTASSINLISNNVWLANVIAAVDFYPSGEFISSPIAAPQYAASGNMLKFTNLKGVFIGGVNHITNNVTGISNALAQRTSDMNLYRPNGVKIDVYLRSADSVDGLGAALWSGVDNWQHLGGIPFTNITAALGQYDPQASIAAGRIKSNAQYYQYKVRLLSTVQGMSPILTNVALVFDASYDTGEAARVPVLYASNNTGRQLILSISNFYDPYSTRIMARDRSTGVLIDLNIIDMTVAPYSAMRTVVADLVLPFANYDLIISNTGVASTVVWQKAIMAGFPESEPIDIATMRRAYRPDITGNVNLTVALNIAGSRQMVFEVYNTDGELVHRTSGSGLPGENTILWAPRGRKIPLGVYLYMVRITSDSGTVLKKSGMFVLAK